MKTIRILLLGTFIVGMGLSFNSCSNVRETDKADLSAAQNEPMRDRYKNVERDNTPGHQNRELH
ncbi:MAG: hypothetical protein R2800_12305 [Flavipsychrobacter sp.]